MGEEQNDSLRVWKHELDKLFGFVPKARQRPRSVALRACMPACQLSRDAMQASTRVVHMLRCLDAVLGWSVSIAGGMLGHGSS